MLVPTIFDVWQFIAASSKLYNITQNKIIIVVHFAEWQKHDHWQPWKRWSVHIDFYFIFTLLQTIAQSKRKEKSQETNTRHNGFDVWTGAYWLKINSFLGCLDNTAPLRSQAGKQLHRSVHTMLSQLVSRGENNEAR